VRRWNGWIDDGAALPEIAPAARRLLEVEIGAGTPPRDASLEEVVAGLASAG